MRLLLLYSFLVALPVRHFKCFCPQKTEDGRMLVKRGDDIFCDLLLSFLLWNQSNIWQMTKHNSRQRTEEGWMLVKRGDDKFWVVIVTNDHHCTKGLLFYVLINSATFSSCFSVKKKIKIIWFTENLKKVHHSLTIWNQELLAHLKKFSFRQCPNHLPPPQWPHFFVLFTNFPPKIVQM